MAKFRKRISIAPGIRVNVSKSGLSGTVGVKGASVNVGKNGAYLNTGIPGTGIYDRKKLGGGEAGAAEYEAGEEGQIEDNRFKTPEDIARGKKWRSFWGWFSLALLAFSVILFIIGRWGWGILVLFAFMVFGIAHLSLKADISKAEAGQSESGETGPPRA